MRSRVAAAIAVLAAYGCSREVASNDKPRQLESRVDASALIAKFECNRCHEIEGVAAAAGDRHCVACHQQIHAGTFDRGDAATQERWRARITSLRFVPSLALADRLRRSWIDEFLLAPHDIRPGLVAQMPRLALTRADAEQLAAHLAPDDGAEPARAGDATLGKGLYTSLACGRCHRFSGSDVDDVVLHVAGKQQTRPAEAWALAPDLRHARARMTTSAIAEWIAAPRGAMPALGVTASDARALAAYVATAPLAAVPAREPPRRLPVLAREVTWDEVEAEVFRNVCWHCHSAPELARGDGGPGNSGGFGFASRGLDLSSYGGISSGSLDDAGTRRSVFAKLADGTPRIVAHLYARHIEDTGGVVIGVRGMPLGLPALSLEEIQLVETWIAQGRPR
jgi:hypothetical protein